MKDYLALKPSQQREKLAEMNKEELVAEAMELTKKATQSNHGSPVVIGVGAAAGLTVGELVNVGLEAFATSDLPGAGMAAGAFPWLRMIPHAIAGLICLASGASFGSKIQGGFFGVGLGLLIPAIVRLIDYLAHKGDMSAEEEEIIRKRVSDLEAQLAAGGKKG